MRLVLANLLFSLMMILPVTGAQAGTSEVREVARISGCPPKKIEVFQQTVGVNGSTIYRVDCNLPKAKDEKAPPSADSVFIGCSAYLCELVRPVISESK